MAWDLTVSPQSELCTFLDGMIASTLYCKGDALSSAGIRGLQALHSLYAVGQAVQCLFSFGARDRMQSICGDNGLSFGRGDPPQMKVPMAVSLAPWRRMV